MTGSLSDLAAEYLDYDDKAILMQVGQRASLAEQDPAATSLPTRDLQVQYPHLGLGNDLLELGKRIAARAARELHAVLCGNDPKDERDREKLKSAFGVSDQALAAAVAAVLAGPFGLGGAIAAALAALFVKRLLGPSIEETCKFWSEKFDQLEAD